MIINILQNEHIGEQEKYIFEYILDTLGYFYQWINEKEILPSAEPILCYRPVNTANTLPNNFICIPKTTNLDTISSNSIKWQDKEIESIHLPLFGIINNHHSDISFDLIANIYFHLTRIDESEIDHPDHMDQEIEKFVLYKYDKFKLPVVDLILKYFDKILQAKILASNPFIIKKCAYPNGEHFGVAITHDVDIVRAYHPLKKAFLSILFYLRLRKSPTPQQMNESNKKIWGFDVILVFYKKMGWQSTFFFIARYVENRHFRYRINSQAMKNIFKQLKDQGHEIAYHPSRYAFEHPKRYEKELNYLRKASRHTVNGLRHHYLRCLFPDIWQKSENLGLSYDASLIYREYSGFRAGTTHPFICFDHKQGHKLKLWEIPTSFFESTINNNNEIIRVIIERISQFKGLLNFIWHTNSFHEGNNNYSIWKEIIIELKKYNIFVTTLKNHINWQQQRTNIKISKVKKTDENWIIKIITPVELKTFSLEMIANNSKVKVTSLDISQIKNNENSITITKNNSAKSIELELTQI